ncbi:MAG TPA: universal stress protein [Actinomycetota bacterium]|nr:universal stress protein [Actinomycetota bacterium]
MLLVDALSQAGRDATGQAEDSPPRGELRALLAVEAGCPPFDAAEFAKWILPAGSRVRFLTVPRYHLKPGSAWQRLGEPMEEPAGVDPADFRITLRILETTGAEVSSTTRYGSAPDEILAEAADWGADLILLGHHNGLGRWFENSLAEILLKRSVIPVVVVPQLKEASSRSAGRG